MSGDTAGPGRCCFPDRTRTNNPAITRSDLTPAHRRRAHLIFGLASCGPVHTRGRSSTAAMIAILGRWPAVTTAASGRWNGTARPPVTPPPPHGSQRWPDVAQRQRRRLHTLVRAAVGRPPPAPAVGRHRLARRGDRFSAPRRDLVMNRDQGRANQLRSGLRRSARSLIWAMLGTHPAVQSNSAGFPSTQPTAAVRPQAGQTSHVIPSLLLMRSSAHTFTTVRVTASGAWSPVRH
jgi:hypothetical protein